MSVNRSIKKVAVLGSGIMGSRIACHFANIGVDVLLLDIVPKELTEEEKKKGLTLENVMLRNRIANTALQSTIIASPSPLYKKSYSARIQTGNFTDDMKGIATCDWILEAVIENLDIKRSIFSEVEKHRKQGTLVSSNTSGIPIHLMSEGRSDDFQKHFCGTHFFNPPRYLRLLEIIPGPKTDEGVLDFLSNYGDIYLGKTTVRCKDTPAFIANRIGVYSIMSLFHLVEKMELSVDEVDKLTGPVLGRPKSATFRTCDIVGLDTLVKVAKDVYDRCESDESRNSFKLPGYVQKLIDNKWFGDKSKQGFYKKVKGEGGKSEILSLDLKSMEYKPKGKFKFATLEQTKAIDNLSDRLKILVSGKDKASEFYRASFSTLFQYVSNRIPEIADNPLQVDEAVSAGFGWELGPFETWDAIGVEASIGMMKALGCVPATWVNEMLKDGFISFYKMIDGIRCFYDPGTRKYQKPYNAGSILILDATRSKAVWKNSGSTLHDLGDGVLNLEFHTKMNTIGGEIIQGVNTAIEMAEKDFAGLVIANEGQNFSAGANLAMIFMFAAEQEYDEIDMAIRAFQNMNMRVRYSSIPVVVSPHSLSLGGGCEMTLHADKVVASAETYIGLVEFGVGLIPGGGGSKEMTMRACDDFRDGNLDEQTLREYYLTIAMAKVSTSGQEAFDLRILREGRDEIVVNPKRVITEAKRAVLELAHDGYTKPVQRKDVKVLGRNALGMFFAGAHAMFSGNFISSHDQLISQKLAYVMCGGDLSSNTLVSEQYLLDLEREAFLSLCGERKTLERIQSILTSGKPLRN
ncbi:MAG: enoyl-CoA hydratase/isomerase family protein [Bacteroidia bacterium]|nr:enoyl-CoA hydratase/isomerase family protein [Bacteroidia bacterium]